MLNCWVEAVRCALTNGRRIAPAACIYIVLSATFSLSTISFAQATDCPDGAKTIKLSLNDSGDAVYGPICVVVPVNALRYSGTIKLQTTIVAGSDLSTPFKAGSGKGPGVTDLPSLIKEIEIVEVNSNQVQEKDELAASEVSTAVTTLNTIVGNSDAVFQTLGENGILKEIKDQQFTTILQAAKDSDYQTTEQLYKHVLDLQYFAQTLVFNPPVVLVTATPGPSSQTEKEKDAAAQALKDKQTAASQAQKDQIAAAVSALKDLLAALAPYLPTGDRSVAYFKQKTTVVQWKAYVDSLTTKDFSLSRYVGCKLFGNQNKSINVVSGRLDLLPTITNSAPVAADISVPLITVTCSSPFVISGGLEVSFVEAYDYGLLPTATSGSYTFGVIGTAHASPMPIGMVHARVYDFPDHKVALQVGVGVSAHTQDAGAGGTAAEYLFGGGVGLWRTAYVTFGLHVARTASLIPGYHIGDPVPSGVTAAPVVGGYSPGFGMAFTFTKP